MVEDNFLWRLIWCAIAISSITLSTVTSAPIAVDFNLCVPGLFHLNRRNLSDIETVMCCPAKPTMPAIDGAPPPSTPYVRVRKALQCTDADYAAKLNKAYTLMRALPDDDPRSLVQQGAIHCAYCGGSFLVKNSAGGFNGTDIHYSWLFFPWHRWFMFFHERILQKLLDDPTFSLGYWNWDNPYTVGNASDSQDGACLKKGHDIPSSYNDPASATFDANRSRNARGLGRFPFPNFYYLARIPEDSQPNVTATNEALIESNINLMYQGVVSGATTAETFFGRPYRVGDSAGLPGGAGGSGSMEAGVHSSVHLWLAADSGFDMARVAHSGNDPVFYSHHNNVDRLWQVWKDIGPILGQKREEFSDPDFLDASFLFYDENKQLRRVTVRDSFDTTKLGYVYQGANDAAWINRPPTRCSKLTVEETIAQAESLPLPDDEMGYYHLQAGKRFVLVIDRPDNPHGAEEFLAIDEIKLDRTVLAGFDVYVDLLEPSSFANPANCAEYNGRFSNIPLGRWSADSLAWKQSVTKTFVNIQAPPAPSKVVITIIPFSQSGGCETIRFKSIAICP